MAKTKVFSLDVHEPLLPSTSEEPKQECKEYEDVRDPQKPFSSKSRTAILLTLICTFIILLTTFYYMYSHRPDKFTQNTVYNTSQEYVILSSDTNLHYLLTVPFVVQHWLNLNVSSIVMLCGVEAEYTSNRATREVVTELQRLGAVVLYFKNSRLKSNNFAQNMRNFAAAASFVQRHLSNSTILITSDADYFPFRKKDHFPDIKHGMRIAVFNPDCCRPQNWKKLSFRQYPMATIAMPVWLWKEAMFISPVDVATGEYMEAKANQIFDGQLYQYLNSTVWLWSLDQRLFGLQFYRMIERHPEYKKLISGHSIKKRLGRGSWWTPEKISKIDLSIYDDAHISPAIYNETIWRSNKVFFRRIFSEDQAILLENYRDRAVQFVNATEIVAKHYHPG